MRAQNDEIARNSRALDERSATAKRIAQYGSSEALGEVLLRYRAELANYAVADPTERLSREMGRAIIRRINYEEALSGLVSASGFVNRQLRDAGLEPESIAGGTRATLLDLAQTYRDRLRTVMAAEPEYITALGELEKGLHRAVCEARAVPALSRGPDPLDSEQTPVVDRRARDNRRGLGTFRWLAWPRFVSRRTSISRSR